MLVVLNLQFMSRKIIIAGNWKMNMKQAETQSFLSSLTELITNEKKQGDFEVLVFPPFTSLETAQTEITKLGLNFRVGAQDISQFKSGAYTGEISADMLAEINVNDVLVGHSERREIMKEDNSIINAKLKAALESGFKVILCCGESQAIRENGSTDNWVCEQMQTAFAGLEADNEIYERVSVAYEPIWAIGTGKTCDSTEANRVISVIRSKLAEIFSEKTAAEMRILYGGSVNSANIEELLAKEDIDGALIGGAAIKKEEFSGIIKKTLAKHSKV